MRRLRFRPWQIAVAIFTGGFLALNAATHTIRIYHWFTLLAIPAALWSGERGRKFFLDWIPLLAFWISYDRLRWVQPLLLDRVAVRWPYRIEQWVFGWSSRGGVPPHAARAWLATAGGTPAGSWVLWMAQVVYLSHIFAVPVLLLIWWVAGLSSEQYRGRFARHLYAFTALNAIGLLGYVVLPVAPPWWVTLYGTAQPSPELVRGASLAAAMDGRIVQEMIKTAADWFAAIPSLHAAYPTLLLLLGRKDYGWSVLATIALYDLAMWIACVALNQHYIIDLIAGAMAAAAACWIGDRLYFRRGNATVHSQQNWIVS
ncbi:MAG TPA: phosphatase PAP2 family protein [Acidobacteriota bacterium]|jgi:hypothetical protein|nr:phosphatase PAP2 family protein [Acidobacteriota bacterium]